MNIINREEIENLFETLHPKLDLSNIITVDYGELSKVLIKLFFVLKAVSPRYSN
ncbi:hypothetical protein V7111_22425 [Neobacillus niacini]|uniref:hypothetical protein n=1 Tax=Neobacillus niacini TaxID=86668 RepID=UPI0030015A56